MAHVYALQPTQGELSNSDATEKYPTHSVHLARHTLNGINSAPLNGSIPSVYVKWSGREEGVKDREGDKRGGRD